MGWEYNAAGRRAPVALVIDGLLLLVVYSLLYYRGLGLVVLISRLLVPNRRRPAATETAPKVQPEAIEEQQGELAIAA